MADSIAERWQCIPVALRQRAQWCISPGTDDDKAPRTMAGKLADSTDPTTWTDFDTACRAAAERGWHIGYMLHEADPFACIDLDVKDSTPESDVQRYESIIATLDSYTERSRSGRGWHVFVEASIGKGRRRDGVEVYSQERFIICTGDVVRDLPIVARQDMLANMIAQMAPPAPDAVELWGGDHADWSAATRAAEDTGEMGRLFGGDWEGRHYESQSEADLALVKLLLPLTASPRECWLTFRLSNLGKRPKAGRADYAQRTMALAMQHLANDSAHLNDGERIAAELLDQPTADGDTGVSLLDRLSVDWDGDDDPDVPDIVAGLVADEDVTLLGGHGGVGKSFLAMQIGCAVALGEPVLGCETRQLRVLYYSAEDGRKRLTRRLRRVIETFDYDATLLRENLRVLDASEVEPLYGETVQTEGKRAYAKVLGPRADFDNLQRMVEAFDPQLVVIDGGSDTFDGNEIVRREVRAFIKMLRQVHPRRAIAVMLLVHIDRSSARGYSTNDDGYAGSAQWHNSCRRRMWLQHQVKRDPEDRDSILYEGFVLRVMKNQDGQPMPDMELQRGEFGLWQLGGVVLGGDLAPGDKTDHSATIARLIGEYYDRGQYMSASLAAQASTGVYPTLKGDPSFPQGLSRKRTADIVRGLKRNGVLAEEAYQRPNRTWAERWMVMRDPDGPFEQRAQTGTG
jgi:hypothetical protein